VIGDPASGRWSRRLFTITPANAGDVH